MWDWGPQNNQGWESGRQVREVDSEPQCTQGSFWAKFGIKAVWIQPALRLVFVSLLFVTNLTCSPPPFCPSLPSFFPYRFILSLRYLLDNISLLKSKLMGMRCYHRQQRWLTDRKTPLVIIILCLLLPGYLFHRGLECFIGKIGQTFCSLKCMKHILNKHAELMFPNIFSILKLSLFCKF